MKLIGNVWGMDFIAKGYAIPQAIRPRGGGAAEREKGGEGASDVSELTIFADGASLADLTTRANMFLCMCMYAKV